jgi:hypothetical protein
MKNGVKPKSVLVSRNLIVFDFSYVYHCFDIISLVHFELIHLNKAAFRVFLSEDL